MSAGAGPRLAEVDAALAGRAALPRDNGELVFEEPWQGRALGMGVVVLDRTGASWTRPSTCETFWSCGPRTPSPS